MIEMLMKNKKLLGIAFGAVGTASGALIAMDKVQITDTQHSGIAGAIVIGGSLIATFVMALLKKGSEPPTGPKP